MGKIYRVNIVQRHEFCVFVEADNEEQAEEKVIIDGEAIVSMDATVLDSEILDATVELSDQVEVDKAFERKKYDAIGLLQEFNVAPEIIDQVEKALNLHNEGE